MVNDIRRFAFPPKAPEEPSGVTFRSILVRRWSLRRVGRPGRHAGASRTPASQDELAAVKHDDLPGERQAEAQAAGAGRVERADLAGVVAREAGAVVLD